MKGFTTLVLVVIAATVVIGQNNQQIAECKAKVGATDADVAQLTSETPSKTRTGGCLMACLQKKSGLMDKDNKIDVEGLKQQMAPVKQTNKEAFNRLSKALDECKAQGNSVSDPCERAKMFDTCLINTQKAG